MDIKLWPAIESQFVHVSIIVLVLVVLFSSVACTTTGIHDADALKGIDFGEMEEIRFCVLTDEGVTEEDAQKIMKKISDDFSRYGLMVKVPWIKPWVRNAFSGQGIIEQVALLPLEPPCDRLLAFVGREFYDFLFGLLGAETLGAVETTTHTKGFVVATRASINQIFLSPENVAIHEAYHLLGCTHKLKLDNCYEHIRYSKQAKRSNKESGNDFFPGISAVNAPINSRQEVDFLTQQWAGTLRSIAAPR